MEQKVTQDALSRECYKNAEREYRSRECPRAIPYFIARLEQSRLVAKHHLEVSHFQGRYRFCDKSASMSQNGGLHPIKRR
jgi:hypothetical protein